MLKRLILPLLVVAALAVAGGVWYGLSSSQAPTTSSPSLIEPASAQVTKAEAARQVAGSQTREVTLTAAPASVDLGDRTVQTWAFNGQVPAPTIRVNAGDVIRASVVNDLPAPLTVHWHGIALRNDMDGVPDLTQKAIAPGKSFTYEFTAPSPGTYFYHPHTGTQLDRGLYGALIVEDPKTASSQADIPLLLDDWIDGTGQTPDDVLKGLEASAMDMGHTAGGSDMGGMDMGDGPGHSSGMDGMDMSGGGSGSSPTPPSGTASSPLGTDISDVKYPLYVINGKVATDPEVHSVAPGDTVRLRLINAASATPFRVAFGGGQMTVVATDGYPVQPVRTDALLIGMGERYDVEVTIPKDGGAFPLVAVAEGQDMQALAVLRTGKAPLPMADVRPAELDGHLLTLDELRATSADALSPGSPDKTYHVDLTGTMMAFDWGIKAPKLGAATLPVKQGQRIRLVLTNTTTMWHPIHLHGHTFQMVTAGGTGPRKDTVVIPPKSKVTVDFIADNPGQWVLHCHNIYHAEAGMMTRVSYLR